MTYIGSLSLAGHPVYLLLVTFTLLRQNHPDSALLLVGGGEDFERLKGQSRSLARRRPRFSAGVYRPKRFRGIIT